MNEQNDYYAFISYKREDEKWAKWLQNKLEHYKFPTNLNGRTDLPRNIRPTFRDVTDLNPGLLANEIDKALRNSEWLIVVCSPRSAKSPWVCKEAQTFIDLGRADHIIPFVIEGNPFSNDNTTECYPDALLNLTGSKELLAANINEMGRDAAVIKVIARMFNLRFDLLWQRYEREQRRKRWMWIGYSILIALLGLSIGGYFVRQNAKIKKSQSHFIAEKAERLIESGDVCLAVRLLLTRTQSDLLIPEIEYGLRKAYNVFEEGINPISIVGMPYGKEDLYNINIQITKDGSKGVYTKDKSLLVFNTFNGKTIFEKTWNENIYNVELCNDDMNIVISDASGTVYMLSLSKGDILYTLVGGEEIVEDITVNDRSKIIAICSGKNLKLWNYNSKQLKSFEFSESIRYLKCDPNGDLIAVSNGNKVDLYNIATNEIVNSFFHEEFCYDADFSSDGKLISTCSDDSIVKIWNVSDGNMVRQFKLNDYVSTAIFDKAGDCVVTLSGYGADCEIRILNIEDGGIGEVISGRYLVKMKDEPIIIDEFTNGQICMFSPFSSNDRIIFPTEGNIISLDFNGDRALISSTEGLTRLWNIGADNTAIVFGHSDYTKSAFHGRYMIRDVQMNREGNLVVTVGDDNLVKLWSYPEFNAERTFIGHTSEPHTVRFSSNEKYIVSSSYDKTAILWDVNTQSPIHILPHEESVGKAEFIYNDKYIMTISGHDIIIWSFKSGKQVQKLHIKSTSTRPLESWEPDGDDVIDVVYDESLNQIFASYRNGIIRVWGLSGEIIKEFNAHHQMAEICYSPKLKKLISWSENGELYAWGLPTYKKTLFKGHKCDINEAKLLHNGYELISSDDNGNIYLWDLRTGKMKYELCNGTAGVQHFSISDNDQYLLALTNDDILKIISISDGSLLMEYENVNFYLCPIMNKECDAIIAPLGDGWINAYQFPNLENLIQQIKDELQEVTLNKEEKGKYLYD